MLKPSKHLFVAVLFAGLVCFSFLNPQDLKFFVHSAGHSFYGIFEISQAEAKGKKDSASAKFTTQSTDTGPLPAGLALPAPPNLSCVYPNPMVPQPQCNMGAYDISSCGGSPLEGLDDFCDSESTALPPFSVRAQVGALAQQKMAALTDCDQRVARNKQLYQCLKTQALNLKDFQEDLFKRNIVGTLQNGEKFFDLAIQAQNRAEQLTNLLAEKEQKLADMVQAAEGLRNQANQATSVVQEILNQSKVAETDYKRGLEELKQNFEPRIDQAKNVQALSCFDSPVPGLRCETSDTEPLTVCGYLSCMTQYYANNARVNEEGQVIGDRNSAQTAEQQAADKKAADFDVVCGNIRAELSKADKPVDRLPQLLAQYNGTFNAFADGSSKLQGRSYSERLSRVYLNCFTSAEQSAEVQGLRREYESTKRAKKDEFEAQQKALVKGAQDQVEQLQGEFQRVGNAASEFGMNFTNPALCSDKKGVEQALCVAQGYKTGINDAMYKTPINLRINVEGGFGLTLTSEGLLNLKNTVTRKTEQMRQYVLNVARYLEGMKERINDHVSRCVDAMTAASQSARRNLKAQVENLSETVGAGDSGIGEEELNFQNLSERNRRTAEEGNDQLVDPQQAFGKFSANGRVTVPQPAIMESLNQASKTGSEAKQKITDSMTKFEADFSKCTAQIQKNQQEKAKEETDKKKEEAEKKKEEKEKEAEKRQELERKRAVAQANSYLSTAISRIQKCFDENGYNQAECNKSFREIDNLIGQFSEISGIRQAPACPANSTNNDGSSGASTPNCSAVADQYINDARRALERARENDASGAF